MCPECLTSTALIISGVISTGGVGALAVKIFRSTTNDSTERRNDDANRDQQQTRGQDSDAR